LLLGSLGTCGFPRYGVFLATQWGILFLAVEANLRFNRCYIMGVSYLMALLQKGAPPQLGFGAPSFARARAPKRALARRRMVAERMVIGGFGFGFSVDCFVAAMNLARR
jgi:hypothetical protein